MSNQCDSQAAVGGYFSLFNLPPTVFREHALIRLGEEMTNAFWLGSTSDIPSGYVYLGQLIGHDITRLGPLTKRFCLPNDLVQLRTAALDLDCVYGTGFDDPSISVDRKTGEMNLSAVFDESGHPGRLNDLPRRADLTAIIADDRNDENLIIAQLHVQFLKLHNIFVADIYGSKSGVTAEEAFNEARRRTILCYQEVVVYDFLHTTLNKNVWDYYFGKCAAVNKFIWNPIRGEEARVPIEFSAAAIRFGHSMVLRVYRLNHATTVSQSDIFLMTGAAKFSGRKGLPRTHVVDWKRFFKFVSGGTPMEFNFANRIDPLVHIQLHDKSVLAGKNLVTGNRVLLPDGQTLARFVKRKHRSLASQCGLTGLTEQQIDIDVEVLNEKKRFKRAKLKEVTISQFKEKTPLWFYILADSLAIDDGKRLGPLGSIIVAETIRALVKLSTPSLAHGPLSDLACLVRKASVDGRSRLSMADILTATGTR